MHREYSELLYIHMIYQKFILISMFKIEFQVSTPPPPTTTTTTTLAP